MRRQVNRCKVAVIWIDWYAYHIARFRGLESAPSLAGHVAGVEMVGGVGVHAGLKFREELPESLDVRTLMPDSNWAEANKLVLAWKVWNCLSELNPEVVLVPGYYTLPAVAAGLWAKLHRRQSVLMTESTAFDHQRVTWKELPKKALLRGLFDWAVAGGKAHFAYLHQLGFPVDRVLGSYDVVDNETISAGTQTLRLQATPAYPATGPYFLYVGRLSDEKNIAMLLECWKQYRQAGGTWKLVLVGDGPERSALQATAAASPFVEDVVFTGLKGSRELLPFYAFAGCFVLPSKREPWGLVVNEAAAAALPVLVSNRCGCCADLVEEGVNGFSFTPSDTSTLVNLLHTMEQASLEQRHSMGARSKEIIGNYAPGGFGASVASILARSGHQEQLQPALEASR